MFCFVNLNQLYLVSTQIDAEYNASYSFIQIAAVKQQYRVAEAVVEVGKEEAKRAPEFP